MKTGFRYIESPKGTETHLCIFDKIRFNLDIQSPRRGRKREIKLAKCSALVIIQIYRVPEGDGNEDVEMIGVKRFTIQIYRVPEGDGNGFFLFNVLYCYNLDIQSPRRGRKPNFSNVSVLILLIQIYRVPEGDGNIFTSNKMFLSHIFRYIESPKGTETIPILMSRFSYCIQIYRVPEGDGNYIHYHNNYEMHLFRYIESPKGTETFSSNFSSIEM